jgi:hypothetical protein
LKGYWAIDKKSNRMLKGQEVPHRQISTLRKMDD